MKETELKPCPFCGGEAYVPEINQSSTEFRALIKCRQCGAELDWTQEFFNHIVRKPTGEIERIEKIKTNFSPFEAWNRRADNEQEKQKVEFVSYDGKYPNLCSGTLVLRIDGKIVSLKNCLCSGGGFDENWDVFEGAWLLDLPKELKHLENIITDIVNENIEYGCCGGCV